ncbi:hypothetical protein Q7C_2141 [Methylophaga frappieri]|uniref:Uncharacterized protein n=1 Tax=Methylophaga frappieri (strain ATCC BAA-2434 / DSM 25690 / JAM7) TaxID=754477 RepID=I1YK34_METFJ|nr:hypothetical protein Q7C_2141 [Methylophaga frappieri]
MIAPFAVTLSHRSWGLKKFFQAKTDFFITAKKSGGSG